MARGVGGRSRGVARGVEWAGGGVRYLTCNLVTVWVAVVKICKVVDKYVLHQAVPGVIHTGCLALSLATRTPWAPWPAGSPSARLTRPTHTPAALLFGQARGDGQSAELWFPTWGRN